MSETKKPNVSAAQIAEFLEQTGFVFEMRANEVFLKAGYTTDINDDFLDLEGDTVREIDLIATKVVNDVNIHFVVECKQSVTDKWIFICNKKMPRYYRAVKHLPSVSVETLKEKGLFGDFHVFNPKIPVGHNYICFTIRGDKKAEHIQIDECVHKLPKALLDLASRAAGGRHLFFPVALFSGQIFAVWYRGKLVVEEVPYLQYFVSFETQVYKRELERKHEVMTAIFPALAELEKWDITNRQGQIRSAMRELSFPYQIDFVTEAGLPDYLGLIEKQVAAIRTADWPIPAQPEAKAAEKV
jgi:hypothetical protein